MATNYCDISYHICNTSRAVPVKKIPVLAQAFFSVGLLKLLEATGVVEISKLINSNSTILTDYPHNVVFDKSS